MNIIYNIHITLSRILAKDNKKKSNMLEIGDRCGQRRLNIESNVGQKCLCVSD